MARVAWLALLLSLCKGAGLKAVTALVVVVVVVTNSKIAYSTRTNCNLKPVYQFLGFIITPTYR